MFKLFYSNPENWTLEDIVYDYYLPEKRKRLRPSTVEGYESSFRLYVIPTFGQKKLKDIKHQDVQKWVDELTPKCGPGGTEKAFKCLRQVYRWAIPEWGMLIVDPTVRIILPRKPVYRPKVLTLNEVKIRVKGFEGHELEPTVIIEHDLGLRPGECYALEWEDIDMNTGKVSINKTLQQSKGLVALYLPKNKYSEREIFLSNEAFCKIKDIWLARNCPTGRIIGVLSPNSVANRIKKFAENNDLPQVTMKNCRHTWGTIAAESGVPIEVIAQNLGHSTIETTYRNYVQRRESSLINAQKLIHS